MIPENVLFKVEGISKTFKPGGAIMAHAGPGIPALVDIAFEAPAGMTLGIVGESGSGKTTLAKIIAGLLSPSAGTVEFNPARVQNFRKQVQIIFQNPFASLDPKMRILDTIAEPLIIHRLCRPAELKGKVIQLLGMVGIPPDALTRLPAEFSGGQRQRICIARALACKPKLLILDEPLSSLDLIIQSQMLDLFIDLKNKLRLTYVFISHNLAVVNRIADNLIVMHDGAIVEQGKCSDIFARPQAPYTQLLINSARA